MQINLDAVKDYKVLLVGDAIVDEYVYVKTIGKAVKENALSAILGKREQFNGGVWAAAAHVRNFCAQVDIYRGANVMVNSRLVDEIYLRKLFVTHDLRMDADVAQMDDYAAMPDPRDYDLVIVTDFGHGLVTPSMIAKLSKEARFLAVNAQTSSTNYGFNLVTKYPRADLVVVDELEARLAAHDKDSPLEDVILKLGFKKIIVTRGINGAMGFDGAFERQEGVTGKVIDTMGAGDAFLSVCAPFAAAGFTMRDLVRIGNAAGAVKVGIVGHSKSVNKNDLAVQLGLCFEGAAGLEPWGTPNYG
jgi:bifunctional ADP-heptose synthase (sugar kinase/adenylyltransferase)